MNPLYAFHLVQNLLATVLRLEEPDNRNKTELVNFGFKITKVTNVVVPISVFFF